MGKRQLRVLPEQKPQSPERLLQQLCRTLGEIWRDAAEEPEQTGAEALAGTEDRHQIED